jgi:hypothetical protein
MQAIRAAVSRCVVEDLDLVVTAEASVPLGRPGARHGPCRTVDIVSYGLRALSLRGLAFRCGGGASSTSSSPAAATSSSLGMRIVARPA